MNINIKDNVIPTDILKNCIKEAEDSNKYSVLHGAGDGGNGFKYNWTFYDSSLTNPISFTNVYLLELWKKVKKELPTNIRLIRSYINAHTYGVEDAIHTDEIHIKKGLTVIIYLCNNWYPEWFGQTIFFESLDKHNNEIVQSVIPKFNRMLIFDKNIPHCVSPLSRKFVGVRLTCMFKVEVYD
jgi:Rps23 Pro-64 3,4-dihydroxylase Tpa1-like proline 4-hydroxylase